MTLNEFKAWLEGFEAGMGGNPPTAEQWAAIKAKLVQQCFLDRRPDTPFRASYVTSTDAVAEQKRLIRNGQTAKAAY
jgi:hypothetical protein